MQVGPIAGSSAASVPLRARFRSIVLEHSSTLRRLLLRVGVLEAEVDDALQDTFLVLFTKQEEVPPAAEHYYLTASALRVAANRRRGGRRRGLAYARYLNDLSTDAAGGDLEELGDRAKAHEILSEALRSLPRDLRDVLMMVELDELPVPTIASQLGLPVGTAASRLRRARRAFDERVREGVRPAAGEEAPVVFHWWATAEERTALDAVLNVHQSDRPRTRFIGVHGGGVISAKSQLNTRMIWNQPPDVFQASAGPDLLDWVRLGDRRGGGLLPLGETFGTDDWTELFPRELVEAVTFGGSVYAVPLNIHRTNNLFFNRRVLAEMELVPPSTIDGFFDVASRLKAKGVVPLALAAHQPWPITMLAFENLMVSVAGPRFYKDFFSGLGDPTGPELRETLEVLNRVLSFVNDDAADLTWDQAVSRVMSGGAAMCVMGDWVRGYLSAKGYRYSDWRDDRGADDLPQPDEFGQEPMFGSGGVFVFTSDVFAIPAAARSCSEAADLLRTFGSGRGQVIFSRSKGSIPARLDVDTSDLEPAARKTIRAFHTGTRVPTLRSIVPRVFALTLDAAMGAFAQNREVDELIRVIRTHYAQLALA